MIERVACAAPETASRPLELAPRRQSSGKWGASEASARWQCCSGREVVTIESVSVTRDERSTVLLIARVCTYLVTLCGTVGPTHRVVRCVVAPHTYAQGFHT